MKNINEVPQETNQMSSNRSSGASRTIVALTAGAVAGAVTALLLAPKSGAETRRDLANGAGRLKDTITDSAGRISDNANKMKDNLTSTIKSGIDKLANKTAEMEETAASNASSAASKMQRGTL